MNTNQPIPTPPRYELRSLFSDGAQTPAHIVPVSDISLDATGMNRRSFISAGLTAAAVISLLQEGHVVAAGVPASNRANNQKAAHPSVALDCNGGKAHRSTVNVLTISPNGKLLVSGSGESSKSDNTIKLWSLPEGALIKTLKIHRDAILSLAVTPDGNLLLSASKDKTIRLWTLPRGVYRKTLKGHKASIHSVIVSPDGKLLVSADNDGTIKLWALPRGILLKTLEGGSAKALSISVNGEMLASGADNGTIQLWSLPEGTLLKALEGHKGRILSMSFSPDSTLLTSVANDKTIKIWTLPDGSLLESFVTFENNTVGFKTFVMNSEEKLAASVSFSVSEIQLWTLPEGALIKTLGRFSWEGKANALAVSSDGKLLACGYENGTLLLRSLPSGDLLTCLLDLRASPSSVKGVTVKMRNEYGQIVTYTLPCGSPIPPGATCTCNCVPGSYSPPRVRSSGGGYGTRSYCSCNQVCTCVPVYR